MRLQQLFPRIVAADYEQPKRVSEECRHLLKRMLTPDPNKRVTIPEIMQHPWCAPLLSPRTLASCLWMALECWTDRQWLMKGRQPAVGGCACHAAARQLHINGLLPCLVQQRLC